MSSLRTQALLADRRRELRAREEAAAAREREQLERERAEARHGALRVRVRVVVASAAARCGRPVVAAPVLLVPPRADGIPGLPWELD